MKATIEFEIDSDESDEITKLLLIQKIVDEMQLWMDGESIINIKFEKSKENEQSDKSEFHIN